MGVLWGKEFSGLGAPVRNALLYTRNVLLPVVDLGYRKWIAHGTVLAAPAMLVVVGWVPATVVAATFAGVLRRDERLIE